MARQAFIEAARSLTQTLSRQGDILNRASILRGQGMKDKPQRDVVESTMFLPQLRALANIRVFPFQGKVVDGDFRVKKSVNVVGALLGGDPLRRRVTIIGGREQEKIVVYASYEQPVFGPGRRENASVSITTDESTKLMDGGSGTDAYYDQKKDTTTFSLEITDLTKKSSKYGFESTAKRFSRTHTL